MSEDLNRKLSKIDEELYKAVSKPGITSTEASKQLKKVIKKIQEPKKSVFKPKTKDSHEIICKRCDTHFDSMDKVLYRSGYKAYSVCPNCGFRVPVRKITQASGYMRHNTTGQLIRKDPKPNKHMSKKDRRRLRSENNSKS